MFRVLDNEIYLGKETLLSFHRFSVFPIETVFCIFLYLVADLSCYYEKTIKALQRAQLGVAGHLSATSRWGNPSKCVSQRHS